MSKCDGFSVLFCFLKMGNSEKANQVAEICSFNGWSCVGRPENSILWHRVKTTALQPDHTHYLHVCVFLEGLI